MVQRQLQNSSAVKGRFDRAHGALQSTTRGMEPRDVRFRGKRPIGLLAGNSWKGTADRTVKGVPIIPDKCLFSAWSLVPALTSPTEPARPLRFSVCGHSRRVVRATSPEGSPSSTRQPVAVIMAQRRSEQRHRIFGCWASGAALEALTNHTHST
jgi:hypothetical protein